MKLVIADSKMKAGDNGEYFYDYVMKNHPNDELYFIISKESSDFKRLKNKGFNVIDVDDNRVSKIFDDADYILFSKNQTPISSPMCKRFKNKRICLQHGIVNKNSNIGDYFNKLRCRYICSVSECEKHIIENLTHNLNAKPIITGLSRWDTLIKKNSIRKHNNMPHILITFHWRNTIINKDVDEFKKSDYLKNINSLLNSVELKMLSNKCEITFMYHATFEKYKKYFKVPPYIKNGMNLQFQDMLVDSDAIVTDFSSNAYEMAVIGKPTFYYIPDIDYVRMYMTNYKIDNLKTNSIGKYCEDMKELLNTINSFVNGEFKLSDLNKKNIKEILGNIDSNNCKRLYDFLANDLNKRNKKVKPKLDNSNEQKVIHTGGIWNKRRKTLQMVDEQTLRPVKSGNKIIYV